MPNGPIAYLFCVILGIVSAFPEQGKWTFNVNQDHTMSGVIKGVYNNTNIYIKVLCDSPVKSTRVNISYVVRMTRCYQETIDPDDQDLLLTLHDRPDIIMAGNDESSPLITFQKSEIYSHTCDHTIVLETKQSVTFQTQASVVSSTDKITSQNTTVSNENPVSAVQKNQTLDVGAVHKRAVIRESEKGNSSAGNAVKFKNDPQNKQAVQPDHPSSPNVTFAPKQDNSMPQCVIPQDGIFVITIKVESAKRFDNFTAQVELDIKGVHGYLSAVDWPLLPFYGTMCVVYFLYGLVWLVVLALQWRDLLRIQFWIGGVIFLGMIEKAVFYAEYQAVNSTGTSVRGAVLFAEFVSCFKRTLARMLVIVVSLGFGIVKPRLGPMLHRVVGIGGLYFLLCSFEAFLRIMRAKNDTSKTLMLAEVPLAILDTAICWWIFSNLVQTTRTLRLRRNIVKLSLYRHFTNTLIFACLASVAFMVWVYKEHNLPKCVTDWKELWVDDAYWHLLFSVILLVIMILWRPTNNNQRYAFTPLIDAADEEDGDAFMVDAFDGMKMRGMKTPNAPATQKEKEPLKKGTQDDDLAWVEENIPSSLADSALPSLLDSDEEIMNTKFEMSKME